MQIIGGISFYATRCALMLDRLGKRAEADAIIKQPIQDYFALFELEESASMLVYAPEMLRDFANYYRQTNRLDKVV